MLEKTRRFGRKRPRVIQDDMSGVRLLDPAHDRESAWKFLEIFDYSRSQKAPDFGIRH